MQISMIAAILMLALTPPPANEPQDPAPKVDHDVPAQASPDEASGPAELRPFDDIVVYPDRKRVEIRAWVTLEEGFLEQIACAPGTREHESLVVIRAKASQVHAALLLAGLEPGTPGRWIFHPETEQVELIEPQGPALDVLVRYEDKQGRKVQQPVRTWIRDHESGRPFPKQPWVFGGSMFRPNPEFMGPGEHYVADMTGSIIGLVTFGDEVVGLKSVISDQAAIHQPEWEVNTEVVPAEGSEVVIILQARAEADEQQPHEEDSEPNNEAD